MKKLVIFALLLVVVSSCVISVNAYDDNSGLIIGRGNFGGGFGEYILTPNGVSIGYQQEIEYISTVSQNVYLTYFNDDVYELLDFGDDFNPLDYYPIRLECGINVPNELDALYINTIGVQVGGFDVPFISDTVYGSFALITSEFVNTSLLQVDFIGDYIYSGSNPQNDNFGNSTYVTLLIPIRSMFFDAFCPYDVNGLINDVYEDGYQDGIQTNLDLFAKSPYGLVYNGIGELIFDDVALISPIQDLCLSLVSLLLTLIIVIVPILVVFWLFKVVLF